MSSLTVGFKICVYLDRYSNVLARHRTCFACESRRLWFFCQPVHRACVKMTSRVGKHESSYMPGIDWETGDTRDNFSNRFYECSLDLFLKQNVKDTTRNIPGQTPSLLDLIFSNDDNLIQGITHRAPLGKSDHDIITFELNVIIPRYALPDSAVYDKGKYDEFRSFVNNFDWSDMKNSNLEESW